MFSLDPSSCEVQLGSFQEIMNFKPRRIFDDEVILFFSEISSRLLRNENIRNYPDLATFGFWCRAANLKRLKESYGNGERRLGVGSVFHVTPRNVPLNFAFSWAFSLLAGNRNFVKLPSLEYPQIDILLETIQEMSESQTWKRVSNSSLFFRSNHESQLLQELSQFCEGRIIWGSEKTVNIYQKFTTPIRHSELIFPSRYSIAIISISAFYHLPDDQIKTIVSNFLKDALAFGQRGCSSPRILFWFGDPEYYEIARAKFWKEANRIAINILEAGDFYTRIHALSVKSIKDQDFSLTTSSINAPLIHSDSFKIRLEEVEEVLTLGTFQESRVDSLDELLVDLDRNVQTVTYFGIEVELLFESVVQSGFLGIDRVVPFGAAFDMTPLWDGVNIIERLSRVIETR